jgi:hypothetical protein
MRKFPSAFLVAAALLASSVSVRAAGFDKRLAGKWTMDVVNEHGKWQGLWDIQSDGAYTLSFTGTSPLKTETGKMSAAKGKFNLAAASGRKDHGTYKITAAKELEIVNAKGKTTLFKPAAAAPKETKKP